MWRNSGKNSGSFYDAAGIVFIVVFLLLGAWVATWYGWSCGLVIVGIEAAFGILLFGVGEIITTMSSIKDAIDSTNEKEVKEKEKEIESE